MQKSHREPHNLLNEADAGRRLFEKVFIHLFGADNVAEGRCCLLTLRILWFSRNLKENYKHHFNLRLLLSFARGFVQV